MQAKIFSNSKCEVGEGPFWHPDRQMLFWFDLARPRLFCSDGHREKVWNFDHGVSAAGVIDESRLLVAGENGLFLFNLDSGARSDLIAVQADDPTTRSNDGRTDRQGGFWFSLMSKDAAAGRGAIYRYYHGELRQLHDGLTIPNAICFSPDGSRAYFTDTPDRRIMQQPLDPDTGWPVGPASVFVDLRKAELNPDGAIVDRDGNLWVAFWGAGAIQGYHHTGHSLSRFDIPTPNASCPAFGGTSGRYLFVTSATHGLGPDHDRQTDPAGKTFLLETKIDGLPEGRVCLLGTI